MWYCAEKTAAAKAVTDTNVLPFFPSSVFVLSFYIIISSNLLMQQLIDCIDCKLIDLLEIIKNWCTLAEIRFDKKKAECSHWASSVAKFDLVCDFFSTVSSWEPNLQIFKWIVFIWSRRKILNGLFTMWWQPIYWLQNLLDIFSFFE